MGSCLSTQPGDEPAWPHWWRKGHRFGGQREGAAGGGVFFSSAVGGGKLPGAGGEMMTEEELARVAGRTCANGASAAACLHTQQGRKGTNQDAMVVWESFNSGDSVFCGVFDGHGPYGHFVARKVRDSLPVKLLTQWKTSVNGGTSPHLNGSISGSLNSEETAGAGDDEWGESVGVDGSDMLPETFLPLKHSYLKAFKSMDKELKMHPTIDCFCSGSTAVTLVKQGCDLVVGNLGDSRAVMATRDAANNLTAVQLTVDLKPNLPKEAARIQQCRGRVFALQDEPEVSRVWLPNNDSPGLAMARAFGDFCLKDYGLISVPEISYRRLTEKDEFIILATDGVWDVLSNKDAVDIVAAAPSRATAARALVDCAVRSWRLKFPTSKIDDCAAVCLFLDHGKSPDLVEESEANSGKPEPAEDALITDTSNKINEDSADVNEHISREEKIPEPTLEHSSTVRNVDEIIPVDEPPVSKQPERCGSARSLADCISTNEEEEWSALEGVTRVNSLLNLPRKVSGDKRSTSWRKKR
ncbi:probable protein phosphatase 2C 66 [Lolium rigidum]|uniref:probable protein phosphatase 2C 66 n=1 Tax=Lolium rigidum TaxID=89674 RepID=UPI001F5D6BD0|nr:probable protein phosphatase 2C 66 [Lolium rigidum]XP_047083943.1 probable protein phosphatase 2C 66 [Lolium rigidum]